MSPARLLERLDRVQQRRRWLAFPYAVYQAQYAFNTVYSVPYHEWPGIVPRTLRSLAAIALGSAGFGTTTVLTGAIAGADVYGLQLGPAPAILGGVVAIALNTGLLAVLFRFLAHTDVRWRDAWPGACFTAVGWYAVQLGGTALYVTGAQATYGTFATVIGLLTVFALLAQITLYGAEINVVAGTHLWPRGLGSVTGTPSEDADFRAYTAYATRQRFAALDRERVTVDFPDP